MTVKARNVWDEVLDVRHKHHREARIDGTSRELRRAADVPVWLAELGDTLVALEERTLFNDPGDPRETLLELLAIGAAFVDAIDLRNDVAAAG